MKDITSFNLKFTVFLLLAAGYSNVMFGQSPPAPLIRLPFNEASGLPVANTGTATADFSRATLPNPAISNNVPFGVGGTHSFDFGTQIGSNVIEIGNYYVESSAVIDPLKNLNAFTLTGWVNNRSSIAGSGGNRIISWINNGGDGVDLVYQSDGSLRLGVDGWPDFSPAFSSSNKVTTDASAPASNWIFFAVTYQSNGQVQFYFGNNTADATLDVTRSYPSPGVTGSNINRLAIGAFNIGTRNSSTYDRMFRGLIDNIQIHNSVLPLAEIVSVQRGSAIDNIPPSAPTSFVSPSKTSSIISLSWTAATDNVGVTGYEIYNGGSLLAAIGPVTSYSIEGLTANTTYTLTMKAKDAAGNLSAATSSLVVTTDNSVPGGSDAPPIILLNFEDVSNTGSFTNSKMLKTYSFEKTRSPIGPFTSQNTPAAVGGNIALDFGTESGSEYVESSSIINELKGLNTFTLTGWVNCKSSVAGSGGNRIISWINNGGDGVDLVYQSDGSLRLGVDGWPDFSPAFSSPNKVTTAASAPQNNWVFFAVTYQSNGQVQFYFGNNATDAALDVTRTYGGPGVTGDVIAKLAIGTFNSATRNANTYDRKFRGLIDDIRIHTTLLSAQNIVDVQRRGTLDRTPPTAPGNLSATSKTGTTVSLHWTPSTDNYDYPTYLAGLKSYDIFNGSTFIGSIDARNTSQQLVSEYTVTGLLPGQAYSLTIKAKDHAGNISSPSNVLNVTTNSTTQLDPLIHLRFDNGVGLPAVSNGIVTQDFGYPSDLTANVPANVGGIYALKTSDGGVLSTTDGINELKTLSAFTLTGWLNMTKPGTIMSWLSGGGEGVHLQTNGFGEMSLVVDGDIDGSTPTKSSTGKITIDPNTPASNWVFFAVTYQMNGQVQYYFGNNTTDATLDVTRSYVGPGVTGSNINVFLIGCWKPRIDQSIPYSRFYNGLMDDIHVFGSALSPTDIVAVQRMPGEVVPPTAPTNITVGSVTMNSAVISWTPSTDNVSIAAYEVSTLYSNQLKAVLQGDATSYTITGLAPATNYALKLVARDPNYNRSTATAFEITTSAINQQPLIQLSLNERDGVAPVNSGSLSATFIRSTGTPVSTSNNANGNSDKDMAFDFDVTPGNYFVESTGVIDGLKSLNAFTITGWLNNRSSTTGSGGNRIVSWINNGGDGVDVVYQSDGSLRLGVDGWPDFSPASSSTGKVTTDYTMTRENWVFFAVTYQSNGQVQFYFGNNATDATLDVTRTYSAPGVTGSVINKLAIGAFNSGTRNATTYDRMFRGVIDDIQIFGSVLTPQEIILTQHGANAGIGRQAMPQPEAPVVEEETVVKSELLQNFPNPYSDDTEIGVILPQSVRVARITVTDVTGRLLKNIEIEKRGATSVTVRGNELHTGMYFYSLITDGKVVGIKRMVVK